MAQGFAGVQEDIEDELPLPFPDVSPKIADGAGGRTHFRPVSDDGTRHQPAIGVDDLCRVGSGGAEVEQNQFAGGAVVAKVGKIGVALDQSKFEDLPKKEAEEQAGHTLALCSRGIQQGFDRHSTHAGHRQDAFRRHVVIHRGKHELGRVGEQSGVAAQPDSLAQVIRFGVQLTFRLAQQRPDIQAAGQQAGKAQQGGDIVDVAVDTPANAGVLDFYGQAPPVLRFREMHLSDRCRRQRRKGELPEVTVPALSPVGLEYIDQLAHWHGLRVRAQAGEDIAKMRR